MKEAELILSSTNICTKYSMDKLYTNNTEPRDNICLIYKNIYIGKLILDKLYTNNTKPLLLCIY